MHYFKYNIFNTKGAPLRKYCNFTKNPCGLLYFYICIFRVKITLY